MSTDTTQSDYTRNTGHLLSTLKIRENNYLSACQQYHSRIDSGVIVTIRNELKSYKPSITLEDNDLLAICEAFIDLDHLQSLNLAECMISGNGAYLLCELLRKNKHIQAIDLRYNKISDLGAQALSEILQIEGSQLTQLTLHYNKITERGAFHLAQGLKINTVLEELDISHNSLGSYGAKIIRAALMERSILQTANQLCIASPQHAQIKEFQLNDTQNQSDDLSSKVSPESKTLVTKDQKIVKHKDHDEESRCSHDTDEKACTSPMQLRRERSSMLRSPYRPSKQILERWMTPSQLEFLQAQLGIFIKFEGNFFKEEVFNSVTHGLGLLLSIIASIVLMHESSYYSLLCQVASGIFCFTLFFMYLSSTLYHSFTYVPCARHVFSVFDYCSIFLLIAGTYTPVLLVGFNHSPFHSLILFGIMWSVAILGVAYSAYADPHDDKWKKLTVLYLIMSYSSLVCAKPFVQTFATMAWVWIAAGGAFYTAGVWFIANDATVPIFHSIWHICVIFGSACHFFCILWYIVPMDEVERPMHDLTLQHVIDNLFFALPISQLFGYFNGTDIDYRP
eukprot:224165_1